MSLRDEILSRVFIGIGATAESIGNLLAGNDDVAVEFGVPDSVPADATRPGEGA